MSKTTNPDRLTIGEKTHQELLAREVSGGIFILYWDSLDSYDYFTIRDLVGIRYSAKYDVAEVKFSNITQGIRKNRFDALARLADRLGASRLGAAIRNRSESVDFILPNEVPSITQPENEAPLLPSESAKANGPLRLIPLFNIRGIETKKKKNEN